MQTAFAWASLLSMGRKGCQSQRKMMDEHPHPMQRRSTKMLLGWKCCHVRAGISASLFLFFFFPQECATFPVCAMSTLNSFHVFS